MWKLAKVPYGCLGNRIGRGLPSLPALDFETCVTFRGKMVLRAMVLGRLGGLFTPIQEWVLYPSHRPLIESDRLFSV
jgi:hypothetical protein